MQHLAAKLRSRGGVIRLYGTTPPRGGASDDAVRETAQKLTARLAPLPLDAIVVYDIQDESGRTSSPRPFAFGGTIDPRVYARLLGQLSGRATINYKCVGDLDEAAWRAWLDSSAREYGVGALSVVGRPTSGVRHSLALSRAIVIAAGHEARFTVGGVVIAERHSVARSESARMLAKTLEGCGYFISQTVYHAHASERLLKDYLRDCRGAGVEPQRVVLTFAPCGREKTMAFLKWLGVRVPATTERAILEAPNPIAKSIEICRDNLRRIVEHDYFDEIPLGVNVESVSINRDEIDGSIELFHVLAEVLSEREK